MCFFATRPKLREIFAADFQDRVVHYLLVDYLERLWEPIFIHDSYACRRGKGVHAGVARLQQFIQVTADGTRPAWYLQLDIANRSPSLGQASWKSTNPYRRQFSSCVCLRWQKKLLNT